MDDVIVVGGGLSGLGAAACLKLQRSMRFCVLEAFESPGGRVRESGRLMDLYLHYADMKHRAFPRRDTAAGCSVSSWKCQKHHSRFCEVKGQLTTASFLLLPPTHTRTLCLLIFGFLARIAEVAVA